MEDDADWDVRLLSQMPDLARGVRKLSGIPLTKQQESPYGDDWDVIWAGHSGDDIHPKENQRYMIENDPTALVKSNQSRIQFLKAYPDHTRMVRRAGAPISSFGYGVSYRGA